MIKHTSMSLDSPMRKDLEVFKFPTVMIYNKSDNNFIYRGSITNADAALNKLLD